MRGADQTQDGMFSYVPLEQRIPADHPLRKMRAVVDGIRFSRSSPLRFLSCCKQASSCGKYKERL